MRRFRARMRAGVVIGTLVLVASACGGDSGDDTAADDSADTTTTTTEVEETTETPTTAEETTTTTAPATGDPDSEWCQRIREVQAEGAPSPIDFNFFGRTPEQLEEQMKTNLETFEVWVDIAPPEIEADVEFFVGTFGDFVALGDEAQWDLNAIATDPAFVEVFESPELNDAATNIDSHSRGVCGVDFAAAPTTIPSGGDSGDLVSDILGFLGLPPTFLPDDARSCMNDELADDFPDGVSDDFTLDLETLDALEAAATACGIDFGL